MLFTVPSLNVSVVDRSWFDIKNTLCLPTNLYKVQKYKVIISPNKETFFEQEIKDFF